MKNPAWKILRVAACVLSMLFLFFSGGCGGSSGGGGDRSGPDVAATPLHKDFGGVVVGESSSPLEVTIANEGGAPLSVSDISLASGTDCSLDLNGGSKPCAVASPELDSGGNCTVEVTFAPGSLGTANDKLDISSDDPDEPVVSVTISGTGVSAPVQDIAVRPGQHDFGKVVPGNSSSPLAVAIANEGGATLSVTDISLRNASGTDYVLDLNGGPNPCTVPSPELTAGENCTVEVTFTPGSVGTASDTLDISSDDPDEPVVSVPLSGTGFTVGVAPGRHDFGGVVVGESSAPLEVTISNLGSAAVGIANIALASGVHYRLDLNGGSKPCAVASPELFVGENCTVEVTFAPVLVGRANDTLDIRSDDPDEPVARVTLSGSGLALPTTTEVAKLTASDAEPDDLFGSAVSVSGTTAVVGAIGEDTAGDWTGAAYVFERNPASGVWEEVARLAASDAEMGDHFGESVSVSGMTVLVGASREDTGGDLFGAAYVFERDPASGQWEQVAKLAPADAVMLHTTTTQFGYSVSVSNTTAVVGAYQEDTVPASSGAAFVFERNPAGGAWEQVAKLTASDAGANDHFGISVSVDGTTAVVGTLGKEAAYVFEINPASGLWEQVAKLTASDAEAYDFFGGHVSVSGGTAIVGASGEDSRGDHAGAAYVFERNPASGLWAQVAKLTASDAEARDGFGISVSVSGTTAVAGAFNEGTGGDSAGAAYVFKRDPASGTWKEVAKLMASDAEVNDQLGFSVSVSGTTALVGAEVEDAGGHNAGAAYVFE
jgi:hypothetical protein